MLTTKSRSRIDDLNEYDSFVALTYRRFEDGKRVTVYGVYEGLKRHKANGNWSFRILPDDGRERWIPMPEVVSINTLN